MPRSTVSKIGASSCRVILCLVPVFVLLRPLVVSEMNFDYVGIEVIGVANLTWPSQLLVASSLHELATSA